MGPGVGEVWMHKKTGRKYLVTQVDIEGAGFLREAVPSGNFHVYKCLETGKSYARASSKWISESTLFEFIGAMVDCGTYRTGGYLIGCKELSESEKEILKTTEPKTYPNPLIHGNDQAPCKDP